MRDRPETIENDWPRLYAEYPEVYDAFAAFPSQPTAVEVVDRRFSLAGKAVLDVGSGTGKMSFEMARSAARVTGVEPEPAMRRWAKRLQVERGMRNVSFVTGRAEALPVPDGMVDLVTAYTAPLDPAEAMRVVKPGGTVVSVEIAPGWYGGELNAVIGKATPELEVLSRNLIEGWSFSFFDFDSVQEFGSTANIVATYGFIFGRAAIDHLTRTGQTSICGRMRVHYRTTHAPS
jgi:ubiquinone/menaquinone biosynthesis C-methylase UbiE